MFYIIGYKSYQSAYIMQNENSSFISYLQILTPISPVPLKSGNCC